MHTSSYDDYRRRGIVNPILMETLRSIGVDVDDPSIWTPIAMAAEVDGRTLRDDVGSRYLDDLHADCLAQWKSARADLTGGPCSQRDQCESAMLTARRRLTLIEDQIRRERAHNRADAHRDMATAMLAQAREETRPGIRAWLLSLASDARRRMASDRAILLDRY